MIRLKTTTKNSTLTSIMATLIGLTFMTSCDCYQHVSGTVIDKETGIPLQGVTVYNRKVVKHKTVTDSVGHFELYRISGGLSCPPMTVIAEFKNYDRVKVKITSGGQEKIKMKRKILKE
jgi:hypothetical protein